MWKRYVCLFLTVLLLSGWGLCLEVAGEQRALAGRLIRLHVVAASDDPEDQARKLRVRDAVLPRIAALTAACPDAQAAEAALGAALPELAALAARSLEPGETVCVSLGQESFPRRDYESFSLPAGSYRALRLVIGPGAGHNWWCVAFPALCLPAAADFEAAAQAAGLGEEEIALMTQDSPEVRFRFRLLDWLSELFG